MSGDWIEKTLGEACTIARGGSPRPIQAFLTDAADGVNWVKISDATASDKFIFTTAEKIKPAGVARSRLVHDGDFLLSNSMSFGRPYIMRTTGCVHDGWLVLSDYQKALNPDFLYFLLSSPLVYGQFDRFAAGSTVRNLNIELASRVVIPIPPMSEQQRIVAILDEAFANITTAKTNAERNLQNAHALFESHLHAIFSAGGKAWITNRLQSVTTKIGSGATPRGGGESYKSEGVSLIRSLNVHDLSFKYAKLAFLDDLQAKSLSNVEIQARDVLLNITGASIARCCIVPDDVLPARVNQHVSIIRPRMGVLSPAFLHYLLISKPYKDQLLTTGEEGGSTRQAITKAQIQDFTVAYPVAIDEQEEIVSVLNAMLTETQRLESIYRQKLAALDELKKSLLHQAFTGQLTAKSNTSASKHQESQTTTPQFAANVISLAYARHAKKQRERTFGRVKEQKVLHLVETIGKVDLGRRPMKDAAGPNDFQHMLKAEEWAKAQDFFAMVDRGDGGYDFKKLKDFDKHLTDARQELAPYLSDIEKVIDLLIPMDSEEAGVFATVHAAWSNLVIDGVEATEQAILKEAREDWHPDKLLIPEHKFKKAIEFIRSKGLTPDGTGKYVNGQKSLL